MGSVLVRIKRCVLAGRYEFSAKAVPSFAEKSRYWFEGGARTAGAGSLIRKFGPKGGEYKFRENLHKEAVDIPAGGGER